MEGKTDKHNMRLLHIQCQKVSRCSNPLLIENGYMDLTKFCSRTGSNLDRYSHIYYLL